MNTKTILAGTLLGLLACNNSRTSAPANTTPPTPSLAPAPPLPSPAAAPSGTVGSSAAAQNAWLRAFEDNSTDAAPAGFSFARTGSGRPGRWIIQAESGAPSGTNVLAQTDTDDTSFRFPMAVLDEPRLSDVRVSVRCKMVSGSVDQACGIVARYRDQDNYYITRANALEGNIRLYTVQDGRRNELASYRGEVTANVWHDYRLELRGKYLQVFWNGQRVLDHRDATFPSAGKVGVWTKADSVTHFDDLRVEAL